MKDDLSKRLKKSGMDPNVITLIMGSDFLTGKAVFVLDELISKMQIMFQDFKAKNPDLTDEEMYKSLDDESRLLDNNICFALAGPKLGKQIRRRNRLDLMF